MASNFEFKASPELQKNIRKLQKRFGIRFTRTILRKASKPLVKQAKQNASHAERTGDLQRTIGSLNVRNKPEIKVGPLNIQGRSFYAHMVEFGTAAHTLKPKKKKALRFKAHNGQVITRAAEHPGMAPFPFLRPAWATKKKQVEEEIAKEVKKGLKL